MTDTNHEYTMEQIADVYAKLEMSKQLIQAGTDIAYQVQTDIQFYRITNDSNK